MFQYRQVLVRMRRDAADREIAGSKSMRCRKLAWLRELAIMLYGSVYLRWHPNHHQTT